MFWDGIPTLATETPPKKNPPSAREASHYLRLVLIHWLITFLGYTPCSNTTDSHVVVVVPILFPYPHHIPIVSSFYHILSSAYPCCILILFSLLYLLMIHMLGKLLVAWLPIKHIRIRKMDSPSSELLHPFLIGLCNLSFHPHSSLITMS